eukprot:m.1030 g.1030  ORF g.1030 m.1030 type:complete len:846 (+) comp5531_c0_seq1:55-2592(+)
MSLLERFFHRPKPVKAETIVPSSFTQPDLSNPNRQLLDASRAGDLSRIQLALDQGADINWRNALGYTALREVAVNDRFDACRALLDKGADPERLDDNEWTGLHWAAAKGSVEVIRCLIRFGIRLNAKNNEGNTPAHLAAIKNQLEALIALVDAGADLKIKNLKGQNVLELTEVRNSKDGSKSKTVDYLRKIMLERDDSACSSMLETLAEAIVLSGEHADSELKAIIDKLTDESKRLIRSKNDQAVEISKMKGEVEYLKLKVAQEQAQVKDLHENAQQLDAEKRLKEDELHQMSFAHETIVDALRKELESKTSDRLKLKSAVERLHATRGDQDRELARLREEKKRLLQEANEREEELIRVRGEHEQALEALGKIEARFQTSLLAGDADLREMKRQMEGHQLLLARRLRDVQTLETAKKQLEEQLKLRDAELAKSQVKCERAIQELEKEREGEREVRLRDEISQQRKTIEALKLAVLQRGKAVERFEEEMASLRNGDGSHQVEAQLEEELRVAREQLVNAEEDCRRLERNGSNALRAKDECEQHMSEILGILNVSEEDLKLTDIILGNGSFADVKVGHWRGTQVAVKIIHDILISEHNKPLIQQEIRMCSRARHPNIVSICGVVTINGKHPYIILELLEASLTDVMQAARLAKSSQPYLTLREMTDIAMGCLAGVSYLHKLQPTILHGDIRPTNVLISTLMEAKIGDLGASHFLSASLSVGPLSTEYLAPERSPVANGSVTCAGSHNSIAADIYSLGVTLGELFSGCVALQSMRNSQMQQIEHVMLKDVCLQLTTDRPECRPDAYEGLQLVEKVQGSEEYRACPPKRLVRGKKHGKDPDVVLTDNLW